MSALENVLAEDSSGNPVVEISQDWDGFLGPLREMAGMFLAIFGIVAVVALVLWLCIGMFEQLSSMRGGAAQRIIGIVAGAALAGSLVTGIAWMSDQFSSVGVSVGEHETVAPLPSPPSAAPTG